jgi:hypothetical protein
MRTGLTLFFSASVLVAMAGFALSQDKSTPEASTPKLATPRESATPAAGKTAKAAVDYPVICYLEQRDRTITVKAGPKGPLYSVKAADGRVLYENLSMEQLSARAPKLGEFLKTAVVGASGAKADARLRIKVDASVR